MPAAGLIQFGFLRAHSTSPDWRASHAWQYARGKALIEPHGGVIVAEFFDIDKSRSIPPQRRPEAAKLLAALGAQTRRGCSGLGIALRWQGCARGADIPRRGPGMTGAVPPGCCPA